jgi:hypothetical protein
MLRLLQTARLGDEVPMLRPGWGRRSQTQGLHFRRPHDEGRPCYVLQQAGLKSNVLFALASPDCGKAIAAS